MEDGEKIKKGDEFLCIKTYAMIHGEIAFFEGRIYKSVDDGSLKSEIAKHHLMDLNDDFYTHFKKNGLKKNGFCFN
jgi:alpha-acetolactate decarboxylase